MEEQNNNIPISDRQRMGNEIKKRRTALGLTQTQLSVLTGISQANIQFIEKGKHSTGFDQLQKIAIALNCNVGLIKISTQRFCDDII